MYSKNILRKLRNDIPISELIDKDLRIPSKTTEGRFRFLCPLCNEFDTATNSKTNLARCFGCQRNFNPIDMVMVVRSMDFKQAVEYLMDFA
jgi:DNA primase